MPLATVILIFQDVEVETVDGPELQLQVSSQQFPVMESLEPEAQTHLELSSKAIRTARHILEAINEHGSKQIKRTGL